MNLLCTPGESPTTPCFYLTHEQDDYNQIPELQVYIAEALYDVESVVSDPSAYPDAELCRLRDQIVSNLERAWEITGGTEDQWSCPVATRERL